MNKSIAITLFFTYVGITQPMDNNNHIAIICTPYADVMLKPEPNINNNPHNPNQDTQALYYENINILETHDEWYKIETLEQQKVENNLQRPHQGWIEKKFITLLEPHSKIDYFPIIVQSPKATIGFSSDPDEETSKQLVIFAGTKLYARILGDNAVSCQVRLVNDQNKQFSTGYINKTDFKTALELNNLNISAKRDLIIHNAQKFLHTPYFWGGMTPEGIDCSGLTHVCYRMTGLRIPRDSKDQWAGATKLAPEELQIGDLIFFARADDPEKRIRHVALYKGNDQIIDAAGTDRFGNAI